ncbi:MAG: domain / Band 7 family protein [Planctomycetaceae bacterium]|nr:domain / Band 7 family protein [Planctomycetaceae bacterium]
MAEAIGVILFLGTLLFGFLAFITVITSFVIVHPQEEKVIIYWGKFSELLVDPGLYFRMIWGRQLHTVTIKRQTLELARTTVADGNGNPIIIAAVVTYRYVNSKKVTLDIQDAHGFVKTQAMAVLKQVASKYPYESPNGHSLKAEAQAIGAEMVALLQTKVDAAGTEVLAFELSDLSYAPEIAQSMLVRQQAQALVDARKIVVEGAVEIVYEAIHQLEAKGLGLGEGERSRLVSNLLTVICGEAKVQPTYPIHSGQDAQPPKDERMYGLLEQISRNTTPKS